MIKEVTAVGDKWWEKITERLEGVVKQIAVAVLGFLMARAGLVGGVTPLGAALTAGVPLKYILAATVGSAFGCFLPLESISTLRYTVALLAITVIRFILAGLKGIGKSALWSGITAFTGGSGVGIA